MPIGLEFPVTWLSAGTFTQTDILFRSLIKLSLALHGTEHVFLAFIFAFLLRFFLIDFTLAYWIYTVLWHSQPSMKIVSFFLPSSGILHREAAGAIVEQPGRSPEADRRALIRHVRKRPGFLYDTAFSEADDTISSFLSYSLFYPDGHGWKIGLVPIRDKLN